MIILVFMVVGIPIAFVDVTTGNFKDSPRLDVFYGSIAGIIIIMIYSSYKDKKDRQKSNAKRRAKKK